MAEDQIGPRQSPALFWSPERKRFILLGGIVSHEHKGDQPYDVLSLDPIRPQWQNDFPEGAVQRGGETGLVSNPGFKTPHFELIDRDGIVRPHPHHALLGCQFAYAPWNVSRSYKESLNWGALCADPVNREIMLFGGCGLPVDGGGPGTWVYAPAKNTWRNLKLAEQPPPRALSPMVFDPVSKKIVLFGRRPGSSAIGHVALRSRHAHALGKSVGRRSVPHPVSVMR